ncbi:MAG: PDZ domain-containing protein [Spirochaetaceae bacterium]|nr:PDZ domain-containing protein [Spirochaetaceae bacterium]
MRLMKRAAAAAAVLLVAGLPLAADNHAPPGVLVTDVDPNGPAAAAGVQSGDLIVGIDGQPVAHIGDLTGALADAEHAEVTLTIKRGDEMVDQVVAIDYVWQRPRLGLMVSNVQPQHEQLGMDKEPGGEMTPDAGEFTFEELAAPGAIVLEVVPDSPAAAAGLQPGDWITAIDGTELSEAAGNLGEVIGGFEPGASISLDYERDGEAMSAAVTLGEHPETGTALLGLRYRPWPFFQMRAFGRGDLDPEAMQEWIERHRERFERMRRNFRHMQPDAPQPEAAPEASPQGAM